MSNVSRRTVLKSIGLIGLGAASVSWNLTRALAQDPTLPELAPHWQGQPLGRVTGLYQNARKEPHTDAEVNVQHRKDDIVRVRRVVKGEPSWAYNDLWLETDNGYMYSSYVQPMWYHLPNRPVHDLGVGRWAEVTVPYTEAYYDADDSIEDRWVARTYYGCIYRITGLVQGKDGRYWYKVQEMYQSFYIRAAHMRLIPDSELTPIGTDIDPRDKWLEIDLSSQVIIAWDKNRAVWAHRVATGLKDFGTPPGTHYIHDKRLSERMVGGTAADEELSDAYNLGGIAFVCYFTDNWVATHSTFWHNDYGQPHSHGCVNLPTYASKFVYRWSTPYVTEDLLNSTMYVRPPSGELGTRLEVHW